jgi:hypothetical protein
VIADVLRALEIWVLVSMLAGWIFCRCAIRLREQPMTLSEIMRERAHLQEMVPRLDGSRDQNALMRAVRVYDRA